MDIKPVELTIERIRLLGGGPTRIGRICGLTRQAIDAWTQVPLEHVAAVAALTGLTPNELRPDVYPRGTKIPYTGRPLPDEEVATG